MVPIQLSPAQQRALDALNSAIDRNDVVELRSAGGMGRTAVLHRLHEERGGALLDMRAVMDDMQQSDPLALEETVYRRLVAELSQHPLVILDDMQWLMHVVVGCGSYPRGQYLQATLSALADHCAATGTHLVLGGER